MKLYVLELKAVRAGTASGSVAGGAEAAASGSTLDLNAIAFLDAQIFATRLVTLRNLVLVADNVHSVALLRFQPNAKVLSIVARVRCSFCLALSFIDYHNELLFLYLKLTLV